MADPVTGFTLAQNEVNLAGSESNIPATPANGANVSQTTTQYFSYRYPYKKISSSDDYLMVEILEYIPPGLTTQPGSFALNTSDQTYNQTTKIIGSIILPIPDAISDNNAADWGEGSMGPIEAAAASVATKTISDLSEFTKSGKEVLDKLRGTLNSATGQSAIQMGFASAAIKAVLGKPSGQKYLERGAGITFNQNVELLFSGLKLRQSFGFAYDMVPRSQKEAIEIKNIIRAFKKYSAVRKGNDLGAAAGLFLKAPHVFRIRYMSGSNPHPFLNKFKICALPAMAVNYTGSGTYATYSDATPVHINLSLQFQELTPIFYEDYQDTDTTVGY